MNIQQFYDYCLLKKAVSEHFPFDGDTLVFKVGGKMFALSSLNGWESGNPSVNLKCDPERSEVLRAEFAAVLPGFHMSKIHWNTVAVNGDLPPKRLLDLIDHSYELIYKSLPKRLRDEIDLMD